MELSEDLERIDKQESELVLPQFDENVAWLLGVRLRELAASRSSPVVIEIKALGRQLFCCALPGSTPDNAEWIRRKSNTTARFHRSSYAIGLRLLQTKSTLAEKHELSPMDYAAHGGSFPLRVSSAGFVGTVTVSGLPQREDHELVVEALCLHLGRKHNEFALKQPRDTTVI
ncbi:MAG: heme-degrading domain-containing protein [Verrucomicrobia bacterium]|nr:heme-degrading domain-containing protein [Verrucomicrobiota bacterium]